MFFSVFATEIAALLLGVRAMNDEIAAEVQSDIRARLNRPNIDFDDVRAALLTNLDDLIDELIPVSSCG